MKSSEWFRRGSIPLRWRTEMGGAQPPNRARRARPKRERRTRADDLFCKRSGARGTAGGGGEKSREGRFRRRRAAHRSTPRRSGVGPGRIRRDRIMRISDIDSAPRDGANDGPDPWLPRGQPAHAAWSNSSNHGAEGGREAPGYRSDFGQASLPILARDSGGQPWRSGGETRH